MKRGSLYYAILFIVLIQLLLPHIYSIDRVFNYRMDYETTKDNLYHYHVVLEQIHRYLKRNPEKKPFIILGDSVAFGGPGPSNQSIGYWIQTYSDQEHGHGKYIIFNLSLPSFQAGDIYTMLLMLDKYEIPLDNVAINIRYAGFVSRNPGAPIVFWLKNQLRQMDPTTFEHIAAHLEKNGYSKPETLSEKINDLIQNKLYPRISIYRYKEFIKKDILSIIRRNAKKDDSLGDTRPWYEKNSLSKLLEQPIYKNSFNYQPFDMTNQNLQIYFLDKIISMQRNTNTIFFLTGVNTELVKTYVENPGYSENLQAIDAYFSEKPVKYLNLHGIISNDQFTDHTHFTNEGYQEIARLIWHAAMKSEDI